MSKFLAFNLLLIITLILSPGNPAYAQDDATMAETVVHLLSYVSMDYPGAVQDGEIIDEQEYKEQQEFSAQAYKLTQEGHFLPANDKEKLLAKMKTLQQRIDAKKPENRISEIADSVNNAIIKVTGIQTAPKIWPNLKNGKALYAQTCAACHGKNGHGDGQLAKNLDPPPSNFHEKDLIKNFSPYQAYNSIRLGVPGTSMQSFSSNFNEVELWDLAFYIKSLGYRNQDSDPLLLRKEFKKVRPEINLANVANLTDKALLDSLKPLTEHAHSALKSLRLLVPKGKNAQNSLPTARKGLKKALKSYTKGDKKLARTQAIKAYLEGIEPVEARLRTNNADFVIELEHQMFSVRQAIEKDIGIEVLTEETNKALSKIDQADELMKNHKLNYWLTFIIAASIMLREGMEAFLILAVVLALIRSSDSRKALPWLHGGWITAVICGIAGWFLSDYIIQFGGKNREVMEGLVSLLAVLILVYVGFWLHNKTQATKWTIFIKDKIGGYLKKDRMFGLAAFSFMVVFREAFEVILFLQAISLEASKQNQSAIGLGVLAAVLIIAIIAFAFLKYSKKIPVRQLFRYSSWIIVLLAIILIGKGFHSLQESGWISVTNLPSSIRVAWLGIYPTIQTIMAQILLIVFIGITYLVNKRRHQKLTVKEND